MTHNKPKQSEHFDKLVARFLLPLSIPAAVACLRAAEEAYGSNTVAIQTAQWLEIYKKKEPTP